LKKQVEEDEDVICGSCYGAESERHKCCNSCEEVLSAYREKGWEILNPGKFVQCENEGYEGEDYSKTRDEHCRIKGHLEVNRVSGTIHIAPGKTINMHGQLVHDVRGLKQIPHRTDHIVHHLSFGDEFPGQINPLDNTNHTSKDTNIAWHYYLKVVPTEFRWLNKAESLKTNQYSVTRHEKQIHPLSDRLPGLFISVKIAAVVRFLPSFIV